MKTIIYLMFTIIFSFITSSCSNENNTQVAGNVTLEFHNTFGNKEIVLGGKGDNKATRNISKKNQEYYFSELKYLISNIRLIKADGREFPYHINDLDKGAAAINQADPKSLKYILESIPKGDYTQIKFGLAIRQDLNQLEKEFDNPKIL